MKNLSQIITEKLVNKNIINIQEQNATVYGMEVIVGKCIVYLTLLLLSIIQKNTLQTIFFMISFFCLRENTGGFHTKNKSTCYFATLIIYFIVCKWYAPIIEINKLVFLITLLISIFSIYAFAPLNHPNLELSINEINLCKSAARWKLVLFIVIVCLLKVVKIIPEYNSYLTAGIGIDSGLLIVGKILKQEVAVNE